MIDLTGSDLKSKQQQGDMKDATDPWHQHTMFLRRLDIQATEAALDAFEQLGLTGMTLWWQDQLVAFTLGQKLTATQASILRWTKESYRPSRLLAKYVLTPAPTPLVGWQPVVELPKSLFP